LNKDLVEAEIHITGRVQGVGFRPFIYRKAIANDLEGYVINLGDAGVEIVVEGNRSNIERFLNEVKTEAPDVSDIDTISVNYSEYNNNFDEFIIDKSETSDKSASGLFPPDIGICDDCLDDMSRKGSRWYEYQFTACAWCGPRFSGIYSLPYDRERTHMKDFPMCDQCKQDYYDPLDRRFDAQGITCKFCGPSMKLYDSGGDIISTNQVFKTVANLLNEGKIIAIKGIGGIHLASLSTDDTVVLKLRRRKNRPQQPFAVMAGDLTDAESISVPTEIEKRYLNSWRKPIVLVKKRKGGLSKFVAPGLDRIGIMLPYTGIQVMLFKKIEDPSLIMTSGNKPGLPMSIKNDDAFKDLNDIADYFLLHNRKIVNRTDDSVLRLIGDTPAFIRRSRGYIPQPIDIPLKRGLCYSLGAELRNAGAVTHNGKCYTTQYLGDISNLESLDFEKKAINNLTDLLNITRDPDVIGCDLHPGYMTSQLGEKMSRDLGVTLVKSQHHHAHIVSVAAEHDINPSEQIIGIALDGAGYGTDGNIWGGEILISTYSNFKRVGHLENLPMPGGDLCTYYPYRMLISALTKEYSDSEIRDITRNHAKSALPHGEKEFELILKQTNDKHIINTSSSGRFLDSVSAMLGLVYNRTYEGEPAMKLESLAIQGNPDKIDKSPIITSNNGIYILKTSEILHYLLDNKDIFAYSDIAAFGQKYLADGISKIATRIAEENHINKVALSGGVFVNGYITKTISRNLYNEDIAVLRQVAVPPGDGGSCLGQSCISLTSVM